MPLVVLTDCNPHSVHKYIDTMSMITIIGLKQNNVGFCFCYTFKTNNIKIKHIFNVNQVKEGQRGHLPRVAKILGAAEF